MEVRWENREHGVKTMQHPFWRPADQRRRRQDAGAIEQIRRLLEHAGARRKGRGGQDAQDRVSSRREYETLSVKERWKASEAERKYGHEADQTDNVRHLYALYAHGSCRCGLCSTINFPSRVKCMQHSCSGNYSENFGDWFTHEKQVVPDTILVEARKRGKTSKNTRAKVGKGGAS